MVVDVVVDHDDMAETEALKQVLETLERQPAAVAFTVLVEQATQRLPGRVWRSVVGNSVEPVVGRHIRRDCRR